LFKTVLRDKQARPFAELKLAATERSRALIRSALPSNTGALDTNESISPMYDRRKPAFNFALNAGRFALPVDGPCTTKE
jgi:hypothetical protein